jgi:His-Xaa-Ser system protein HxsD
MQKDEDKVRVVGNLEMRPGVVAVSVNPKIYSIDIVYSASYVFLDRAYVVIDGDPESEIIVELRPKDTKTDIEELGRDFNNELINYAVHRFQNEQNQGVKEAIVKRALATNSEEAEQEMSYIDDPLGIAKPWEETHNEQRSR